MREAGLRGCMRSRRKQTTRRGIRAPAEDLLKRNFRATEPDRVWVADITYVATQEEGFLYVAFVLDVYSRKVWGGDGTSSEIRAGGRCSADGAVEKEARCWTGASFRPGVQYTALSFSRLRVVGMTHLGRPGGPDITMAESFVSTLKAELVSSVDFPTGKQREQPSLSIWERSTTPPSDSAMG